MILKKVFSNYPDAIPPLRLASRASGLVDPRLLTSAVMQKYGDYLVVVPDGSSTPSFIGKAIPEHFLQKCRLAIPGKPGLVLPTKPQGTVSEQPPAAVSEHIDQAALLVERPPRKSRKARRLENNSQGGTE